MMILCVMYVITYVHVNSPRLVSKAAQRYKKAIEQGVHQAEAWNLASVDLVAAAKVTTVVQT